MTTTSAESSSQALERYLFQQLESLKLDVPSDDVEYMARFVEEEGLEREEKIEGVRAMLEGVVDGGVLPEEGVDEAMGQIVDEWDRLRAEEAEREAEEEESDDDSTEKITHKNILATLTPEELARAQREALLRQYSYVEGDADDDPNYRLSSGPGGGKISAEEKKAADERRAMIQKALVLDGKKKKHKKQQEVDLLAPNLNKDKVQYKAQMEREAARKAAADKKNNDKAGREKQLADIAKAKADKQKKAAKQERRA